MSNRWELRSKLWLEHDGRPVIGDGRMAMLQSIDRHGSIKLAAQETGISYRRIRGALHEMESVVGSPLVKICRGGRGGGGGAELTSAGHALVKVFKALSSGFQHATEASRQEMHTFLVGSNGNICHLIKP